MDSITFQEVQYKVKEIQKLIEEIEFKTKKRIDFGGHYLNGNYKFTCALKLPL